jgi:hypothetical protein
MQFSVPRNPQAAEIAAIVASLALQFDSFSIGPEQKARPRLWSFSLNRSLYKFA